MKGICLQVGCSFSDKKTVQDAPEENFVCENPNCRGKLQPYVLPESVWRRYLKYAPPLLLVMGLGGVAYYFWPNVMEIFSSEQTGDGGIPPPKSPVASPACMQFLDKYFVLVSAQEQVRLIPSDDKAPATDRQRRYNTFRNWVENERAEKIFSNNAFYIMRFEVSIGLFKTYVDQLSVDEQQTLPESLRVLIQEGDAALPVGYITPRVAEAYASWLQKSFSECFADGFNVRIPSEAQWMGALYKGLDHAQDELTLKEKQPSHYPSMKDEIVYHLLANQREWLRGDGCSQGKALRTNYSYRTGIDYDANFNSALQCDWVDDNAPHEEDGFRVVIEGERVSGR